MVKSFCHCFSNQEEILAGITKEKSYHAFCIVSGDHGAVEFSFRTGYIDQDSAAPFATFYNVKQECEEDNQTPKKVRVHSKKPLAPDSEAPTEKSFLRSPEPFYSYKIALHLHKLRSFKDNPDTYLRTIHSKDLYDEMKAVYSNIFKEPPGTTQDDHWVVLVD